MNREEFNQYLRNRHYRLLEDARERLGGKCVRCNETDDLEFDHVDPKTKEFKISNARSVSKKRLEQELAKCQLLCKAHHLVKSKEDGSLGPADHGSHTMYARRGCRCEVCVLANRNRSRHYKRRQRERRKLVECQSG